MAHNTSRSKKAAYVRAKPLADYQTFHFVCRCAPCRRNVTVAIDQVLADLPPGRKGIKVGEAMIRLRCKGCNMQPSSVMVTNGQQMAVPISGPGST